MATKSTAAKSQNRRSAPHESRVLVVDDEQHLRRLFQRVLGRRKVGVKEADTARSAIECLRNESFDLMFLDIRLPDGDGSRVLREARALRPDMKVVMMTGYGDMEQALAAIKMGAVEYLYKPVRLQNVERILDQYLNAVAPPASGRVPAKISQARAPGDEQSLAEELHRKNVELELLHRVSDAISDRVGYEELLKMMIQSLSGLLSFDLVVAFLSAPDPSLHIYTREDVPESSVADAKHRALQAYQSESGVAVTVEGCRLNVVKLYRREGALKLNIEPNFFNLPVRAGETLIGMIHVCSLQGRDFDRDNVRLFSTLTNQIAAVLTRIQGLLTTEKSKMEVIVENMAEGVIMLDDRDDLVLFNPQARRMLGLEGRDPTLADIRQSLKTFDFEEALEAARKTGKIVAREVGDINQEDRVLRFEFSLVKREETMIGTVVVIRDITQEKEMDRIKSEFISTVSHELRTPLTIIGEGVGQVREGVLGALNEDQKRFLTIVLEGIGRLNRLVNDMLDLSRLETGRVRLHPERANLVEIAESVLSAVSLEANKKGLELRTNFPDPHVEVFVDRDKITQVFTNLIGNALKFTEKGWIGLSVDSRGGQVECSVQDTGQGISQEDLPRIFDKFAQFSRSPGPGSKGTGLGLVICKGIVELHRGRIWCESQRLKGSKFTFTLPQLAPLELFKELLSEGVRKAGKERTSFSAILFDLQGIADFSRSHGEAGANRLLRELADIIQTALRRKGDLVIEGKRKIAVLLPATSQANAVIIAGRIRQEFERHLSDPAWKEKIQLNYRVESFPDNMHMEADLLGEKEL